MSNGLAAVHAAADFISPAEKTAAAESAAAEKAAAEREAAAAQAAQTAAEAQKTGASAERARVAAIMGSEHAKGREAMVAKLIDTGVAADVAVALLAAAPKADAAPPRRLAAVPVPNVDSGESAPDAVSPAARLRGSLPKVLKTYGVQPRQ